LNFYFFFHLKIKAIWFPVKKDEFFHLKIDVKFL